MKTLIKFNFLSSTGAMLLLMITYIPSFGQQNDNWILFLSGVKMSWTTSNIQIDSVFPTCPYANYGITSSVSNASGQLLFYTGANTIWNNNFELMNNAPDTSGSAPLMFSIPNQSFILPSASDTTIYYAYFAPHGGSTIGPDALVRYKVNPWYVNLWQPGTGKILAVDTLYYKPNTGTISMNVIKHGNGRDYWILFHPTDTDTFITWIQNYDGSISGPWYQKFGPIYDYNVSSPANYRFFFNSQGNRMALLCMFNAWIFDFDRCTGLLSNQIVIDSCTNCLDDYQNGNYPSTFYAFGCFSGEGNMFYITRDDSLIQFDLSNYPNLINRTVVWNNTSIPYPQNGFRAIADLKLGKDNKIYVGTVTYGVAGLDSGNTYLGVIRQPDLAGSSCDFERYGIYCNGYRSSAILPNYVNYDLGPLIGSPCDTLITTGLFELNPTPQITLAPNPAQTQATLTWASVKEGNFFLRDVLGRAVLSEQLNSPSGTTRLDLSTLPKGIYLWQVQSAGYSKNGKLVVE